VKTRYTQSEATREIHAISDRYALNRYTVAELAVKDDEFGYLLECFLRGERDAETNRTVDKTYLIRKLKEANRAHSLQSSEATFIAENRLVKQDTRMGQVYYERLTSEPAD
jgi:hypothetical protein